MKERGAEAAFIPPTEEFNPLSEDIDTRSSLEIVEIMNREDARVAAAVAGARASIATVIDWAAEAFQRGGRLFYVGAGSSGRLGRLDAAEIPPTFGVPPSRVQAVVAGGSRALARAAEGAEDSAARGARDLGKRKPTPKDVVVGISAASTTPYVRGALGEARRRGARAVLITSNPLPERADFADLVITLLTGAEILTGSTRLKAGTAAKMALNMISTGAMIRSGRTYGNLMVDLACSNRKLVRRGTRIVASVTQLPEERAGALLQAARFHVKTALAMGLLGIGRPQAEKMLRESRGFLRSLFTRRHRRNRHLDAVMFDMDGTIVQYALPAGFSTWAALGWATGIFPEMEEWVEAYRAGKLTYERIWSACAERIRGRAFAEVRDALLPLAGAAPYSRGFPDCVRSLRGHYRLGIVSSGLSIVAEQIRADLALDFEVANRLGLRRGMFDGTFRVNVPFDRKLEALRSAARKMGIPLARVCFVGDSRNDVEVMHAVGLPVAYRPKTPEVARAARGNVIGDFLQLGPLIERFRP